MRHYIWEGLSLYRTWQSLMSLQIISSFPSLWFYTDPEPLLKEQFLAPGRVSHIGVDLGGTSINRLLRGFYNSSWVIQRWKFGNTAVSVSPRRGAQHMELVGSPGGHPSIALTMGGDSLCGGSWARMFCHLKSPSSSSELVIWLWCVRFTFSLAVFN